ncbi:hypothetical protein [Streptomyces sp. TS71-3]|uniref:hypothetical protein n=1 Tax=Streptomyces sp. TS71-3 TaxID=2733862 RepID=UPI001B11B61E|nr:hypothetical protein [Streptomyces sp. TS71-3]GHJ35343.1 hypothetical protein Sm713_09520 [Streptomyces sp. TS71-3]
MTTRLRRTAGAGRRPALRLPVAATGLCALAALALTGCGEGHSGASGNGSGAQGSAPDGWGTLATKSVDVSYPKSGAAGYTEESAAERGKAAAAAVRTDKGVKVSTITVQLDFTRARSADEAAIGAEAQVQLGATLQGTRKVSLSGAADARRVDFTFTSSGRAHTPPKGSRVHGVILTGLDSAKKTFAVRVDAQQGVLPDADLKDIIDSIEVH